MNLCKNCQHSWFGGCMSENWWCSHPDIAGVEYDTGRANSVVAKYVNTDGKCEKYTQRQKNPTMRIGGMAK